MIKPLIEIVLIMSILLGIYHLLLVNTTMHKLKRFYLLTCLILPLSIPFIQFEVSQQEAFRIPSDATVIDNLILTFDAKPAQIADTQVITNLPITQLSQDDEHIPIKTHQKTNYTIWFITIYGLVTVILLLRYGISIRNILQKTKNTNHVHFHGQKVIITNETLPPHNFLQYIFISKEDYNNEAIRDRLLMHELSHARERHSLDILLVEFLRIIFWFNPLYTLFSHAIRNNHEYLADTAVVSKFTDIRTYQKLLLSFAGQPFAGPKLASPSNYNLIKKRLIMMKHKTPKSAALLRLALLIPLVMITTAFFVVETKDIKATDTSKAEEASKPVQKTVYPNALKPDISPIDSELYDFDYRFSYEIRLNENSYANGSRIDSINQMRPNHIVIKTDSGELIETQDFDREPTTNFISLPGTSIRTTASGRVIETKQNDKRFGNFIRVKHNETSETLYTHLGQVRVLLNQRLTKGEEIATNGEKGDIYSTFRYKIIKSGKGADLEAYSGFSTDGPKSETDFQVYVSGKDVKRAAKYNIELNNHGKKLPDNLDFKEIIFDRKTAIFLKHSGEMIIKYGKDMNDTQKLAILSITHKPYSLITRKNIPQHIVEKWHDINYYKIWIDGKLTDNSEMSKYSPSDFVHHYYSSVLKHARSPSAFQLDLHTPAYHAKTKTEQEALKAVWRQKITKSLKDSGLI